MKIQLNLSGKKDRAAAICIAARLGFPSEVQDLTEEEFVENAVLDLVVFINGILSNWVLLFGLIAMGLFFSIRTRFVQFRFFGEGLKRMFGGFSLRGGKHGGGMSSFQALATAIAAQVGTGNIVGACGAILIGGPGAIFWMWIIALLGMATNYAEAVLAQKTKRVDEDGTVHGGPAYYITTAFKGTGGKFLAGFFAVAIILALGFMGCMVQSNSIAETMNTAFGIPGYAIGIALVILAAIVFFGEVSRLAAVTEKIVPIMAIIYIVGGIVVIIMNIQDLPATFALIFSCAFDPSAGLGGAFFGIVAAITQGAKRGLFSNEAGMGSTPHAHALAHVKDPHDQGVVAMAGVFIDTIIVVTITALVVIGALYTNDGKLAAAYNAAAEATTAQQYVDILNANETSSYDELFDALARGDNRTAAELIAGGDTVLITGLAGTDDPDAVIAFLNDYDAQTDALHDPAALAESIGLAKSNMAQTAFGESFTAPGGNIFVAICLLFFAFSTIISWNMFAKLNVRYLFKKKTAVMVFCAIALVFVFLGSLLSNELVWELADLFNQLMVIPNAIALFALSGAVVATVKSHSKKK